MHVFGSHVERAKKGINFRTIDVVVWWDFSERVRNWEKEKCKRQDGGLPFPVQASVVAVEVSLYEVVAVCKEGNERHIARQNTPSSYYLDGYLAEYRRIFP